MSAGLGRPDPELKEAVRAYWQRQPCGSRDIPTDERRRFFAQLEDERYTWEPYIRDFARFEQGRGLRVLEIGVGAGTDFINWARNGAVATGVDLTEAGIALAKERLALEGLEANLRVADAEHLPFPDDTFDLVYSWGVLHHSPDTPQALREVRRVLKRGGRALIMMYHHPSWTGLMLWAVHCAAKGRLWISPREAVFRHLESPGTKAYTVAEGRRLFAHFARAEVRPQLAHGDLLLMRPSEKYQAPLYRFLWKIYPRRIVRLTGNHLGIYLLARAWK